NYCEQGVENFKSQSPAAYKNPVSIICSKDCHRTTCLFKGPPEKDRKEGKYPDYYKTIYSYFFAYFRFGIGIGNTVSVLIQHFSFNCPGVYITIGFCSIKANLTKDALCKIELQHSEEHKDTRKSKSPMPAYCFTNVPAQQNSEECPRVYSHIQNGIPGTLFLTLVKV